MARSAWIGVALLVAVAAPARSGPIPPARIPAELRPWAEWVLHDREEELCPFLNRSDERRCLWPSRLELDLEEASGRFEQQWLVLAEEWVPLPGDDRLRPQDVTVDGRAAAVTLQDGVPSVRLPIGSHRVAGAFRWDRLPELLAVPPGTGIVRLRLNGQPVPFPNREPQGQLWLRKRAEPVEEARLEVVVHRRVIDEVPLLLRTRVELRVAGRSREELLGRALPEGFVPMALEGPLPARLEPDGRLRVQVRPGTWTVDVVARHEGPASELGIGAPGEPWDDEEVWVFEARPGLRLVTVEGVPAIDPQRTELPPDWRTLPAYLVKPGDRMKLVVRRRGDSDPAPDQLALERIWWLDFDGGGFTIRDVVTGTMSRSWRLEMSPPTALGRVAIDGQDQFLTRLGDEPAVGVEVTRSQVRLEADSRVEGHVARTPAVGWSHDFQSVSGELRLPPGWRLFYASGVDDLSSSWLTDWTLLDLFVVLVTSMAFGRLAGWPWGAVALATLALTYREPGAPGLLWLFVLAGVALVRFVPEGRWRRLARLYYGAAAIVLLLVSIPYLIDAVRQGLWPALERPWSAAPPPAAVLGGVLGQAPMPAAPPAELEQRMADEATDAVRSLAEKAAGAPRRLRPQAAEPYVRKEALQQIDPNAMIQTGPGLPRWTWTSIALRWRGPVERGQEVALWLLSPAVNLVLALVRLALVATLLVCACAPLRGAWRGAPPAPSATVVGLLLLASLVAPGAAGADFPSKELLEELRTRLVEPPECHPECASIPRARLEADAAAARLRLEVEAGAPTAVPLPGHLRGWSPETVLVDGEPAAGLARGADGIVWLHVGEGRHQVSLEGRLPATDSVEIPFPLRPGWVEAAAAGWTVHGIDEDGRVEENLQLVRTERAARPQGEDALQPGALPPFVRVERTLRFGLSLEMDTSVVRLTPAGTAIVLEVPLLPGESPTTPDVRVEGGRAFVSMGPQANFVAWRSILEPRETVELVAPDRVPWTEVWRLDASPVWHVEAEGIPVVHQQAAGGLRAREWRPWPGESVKLRITRPGGVPGPTLTIDRTRLDVSPGLRATDVTLALEIRSSRGGQHAITLPEGAELQSVTIQGQTQPIRQEGRAVTLPIVPGGQTAVLAWREPRGIAPRFTSPEVNVGAPSVNADLHVAMPRDRWTLFLGGGRLGPAVLFWSVLVVLLLVAIALGRIPWTPLGGVQWFLLGIGLTQLDVVAAAAVVGWLLALGWRRDRGRALGDRTFDLVQVVLAGWTLVAFAVLVGAIEQGLLGLPEMQIAGNGSTAFDLRWTHDRAGGVLPRSWVVSVPLLAYRLAMLAWALWLSWAFLRWIRWGWECFTAGGAWRSGVRLWRPRRA